MPLDLSNTLVVGISATALFDMAESDQIFRKTFESDPDTAIEKYREFMLAHEDEPLKPGTGYPLIKALLGLNQYQQGNSPLVEVVVMSQNSPDTGLRVLNTIRHDKLNITRSAFTAGETVADYLDAFDVDLFLTTNVKDAQQVIDSKNCAAAILKAPPTDAPEIPEGQVRIAFDGDAVLFSGGAQVFEPDKTKTLSQGLKCIINDSDFVMLAILIFYDLFNYLARRLLNTICRKKGNWLKKQKEQRCQNSESLQLSMEIPSRCLRSGNGTVRRELESVLLDTMLPSCIRPKGRKLRMLCQN